MAEKAYIKQIKLQEEVDFEAIKETQEVESV